MCVYSYITSKKAQHEMLGLAWAAAGARLQAGSWDSRTDLPPDWEGEQSGADCHQMYMELVAKVWSVEQTTTDCWGDGADKWAAGWTCWQL